MCLGIPGKIVAINDTENLLASVEVNGIRREINVSCVVENHAEELIGKWALVHVGFAMCIIDEQQAQQTLDALSSMQVLEHEVEDFTAVGQYSTINRQNGEQA